MINPTFNTNFDMIDDLILLAKLQMILREIVHIFQPASQAESNPSQNHWPGNRLN